VSIPRHHTTGPSHAADHAEAVAAVVAAARNRLRYLLFVRDVVVAAPAGIATGAAMTLAGLAPSWLPIALGVAGTVAAVARAVVRTPSTAATAARLDAALGLKDRVSATLQMRGSDAAMAPLVARDAARRLEGLQISSVFPIDARKPAAAALVPLAAALSVWLMWSGGPIANRADEPSASERRAGAGNAAAGRGVSSSRGAGTNAARPEAVTAAERVDHEPKAGTTREGRSGVPGASLAQTTARDTAITTPSAPAAAIARGTTGVERAAQARGGNSAAAANGSTGTPRGAGTGPVTSTVDGSGGVARGGALTAPEAAAAAPPLSAARLAAARTGAEAAVARDAVPPAYRDDVRAYFRAIAPGGSR
jgi:hypothetical protein